MNSMINKIAGEYFDFMARNFPVMCANDEFYLFPRTEKALLYQDRLDSLDREKIRDALDFVKKLLSRLKKLKKAGFNLDEDIDYSLLKQSMAGFLREFGKLKIHEIDPNIYIKIFILAFSNSARQKKATLKQAKRLFKEAGNNLKSIPQIYKETALELIQGTINYLRDDALLGDFRKFIEKAPTHEKVLDDRKLLEDVLTTDYSYNKRGPEELFGIAQEEYKQTLEEMKKISLEVSRASSWQEILSGYYPDVKTPQEILKLYKGQIRKLRSFLIKEGIIAIPEAGAVRVKKTPGYLVPIRQTASYNAPLGRGKNPIFYVTVGTPRIHNEYIFMTAHEAYPGHHLLDSKRRSLKNPIRRSVESALFYEGWASYAERLVDRSGYIKDPRERLVGLKRQAWRAIRAMLDIGLRIKRFSCEEAEQKLRDLGYQPELVKSMVRHYALTYGYQLCYTIGKFEFERLRKKFEAKIGSRKFHDLLLESGEIPFDLLEQKLKEKVM